jgi:hypothetical protein
MLAAALLACLPCLTSLAEDNAPPAQAPTQEPSKTLETTQPQASAEAFRLRLTNSLYGPVEASADQGVTWHLVGRVVHQAVDLAPAGPNPKAAVQRSSAQGLALGVGGSKYLRLLPDTPAARKDPTAIVVNAAPSSPLFSTLLSPVDSPVQQMIGRTVVALPERYSPQEGDVLLVTVTKADPKPEAASAMVQEAADKYRQAVVEKLRAANKKPTTGTLTVNANVPPGEKVSVVTFHLDGAVVGILNSPPFTIRLNTTIWTNGEHLIEVRALDANGGTVTRKKALVVVDNPPQPKS